MKFISLFILASALFICPACSKKTTGTAENKQNTASVTQPSEKTDSTSRNNYRFIVSFYSIGSGTEGEQVTAFETFLSSYRKNLKKNLLAEKTHWGREGEVDYCMKLTELSLSDQVTFINEAKDVLKSAKRVHFIENAPCRQGRN
jgi:hypothetical protein